MGGWLASLSLELLLPLLLASAPPAEEVRPRPAPLAYKTGQYGLTFRVPRGTTYCPLPADWIGSDHGTTIFLEPPRRCDGAGYPSSSRGYGPETVARIHLYYGYLSGDEEEEAEPPCDRRSSLPFLGAAQPVCGEESEGFVQLRVRSEYVAEPHARYGPLRAEAILTLVTRPERLARDRVVFERIAASMRTCSTVHRADGEAPHTTGVGPRCPAEAVWF